MTQRPIRLALLLTVVVLFVELAGGLLAHSLALLSDAGHVLTDVFALGLAWFAAEQAQRPADSKRSYGYQRVSILAALVNSVVLIVIVLAIAIEAARRIAQPQPVQGGVVIVTALIGIAINSVVILGLREKTMNVRAAFLHVAGDIAASIGVVIAGVVIVLTGWTYIDPLLSVAIAALIGVGAWHIVRETINLLMEGTPGAIDLALVTEEIRATPKVTDLHDLHVWALSGEESALSVHVVVGDCPLADAEHLVRDLEQRLCSKFDIGHTTIQVESCHPCAEIEHGAGAHNHPHSHGHGDLRMLPTG